MPPFFRHGKYSAKTETTTMWLPRLFVLWMSYLCSFCLETKRTKKFKAVKISAEKLGSHPQQNKLAALRQCFVFGHCFSLHFSTANFQGRLYLRLTVSFL